jgi:hypothetical protein
MDELNEVCAKLLGVTKVDAVDLHETIEAFVEVADGVLESNDLKGKSCEGEQRMKGLAGVELMFKHWTDGP